MALALEMRGIAKRFPGIAANDYVDFQREQGESHTLLGENEAGKTTLIHILVRPLQGRTRARLLFMAHLYVSPIVPWWWMAAASYSMVVMASLKIWPVSYHRTDMLLSIPIFSAQI